MEKMDRDTYMYHAYLYRKERKKSLIDTYVRCCLPFVFFSFLFHLICNQWNFFSHLISDKWTLFFRVICNERIFFFPSHTKMHDTLCNERIFFSFLSFNQTNVCEAQNFLFAKNQPKLIQASSNIEHKLSLM
jgi:hypothetical protein